jgi:probable addiction module antidote protein
MNKRPDFKSFKEKALKNAKVRAEYEALRPEFELLMEFVSEMKKTKKRSRSVSYDEWLIKKLKNHDLAVEYLNNALREASMSDDKESLELLLMALRNVIQAQGGVAKIAKKAGLGRESLYKTVSEKGNPEFRTISAISNALGFEIRFV